MSEFDRLITRTNVDALVRSYVASAETLGDSIAGLRGLRLLEALKRGTADAGPYPSVSIFEAANRIMTDLVMLNGVRWLLNSGVFPFQSYSVEYGHEAKQEHDIIAQATGETLIGEAFNVAASFFATKRNATFKKLRQSTVAAAYRMIMCNHDAVRSAYAPTLRPGEFLLLVNVDSGTARVVPNKALQPSAPGAIMRRRG